MTEERQAVGARHDRIVYYDWLHVAAWGYRYDRRYSAGSWAAHVGNVLGSLIKHWSYPRKERCALVDLRRLRFWRRHIAVPVAYTHSPSHERWDLTLSALAKTRVCGQPQADGQCPHPFELKYDV